MPNPIVQRELGVKTINSDTLSAAINAAFGAAADGISTIGARVLVNFIGEPTDEQVAEAKAIFDAHDADALTPEQAERKAREERIAAGKAKLRGGDNLTLREMQELLRDVLG